MKRLFLIISLLFFSYSCAHAEDNSNLPVVDSVNLERYMGVWYEIARFPHPFQKECGASKAEYELREDGRVNVLNSCREKGHPEEIDTAKGLASVQDEETNAKLSVSFVPIFRCFGWFGGNYWILELDQEYQYAMVGGPSREYLWILARKPTLEASVYNKLKSKADSLGFDVNRLRKSPEWE